MNVCLLLALFACISVQGLDLQLMLFPKDQNIVASFVVQDVWGIAGTPKIRLLSSNNVSRVIEPYEAIKYANGTIYHAEFANLTTSAYSYQVDLPAGLMNGSTYSSALYPFLPAPVDTLVLMGSLDVGVTFQIYLPVIVALMQGTRNSFVIPGSAAEGYTDAEWDHFGRMIGPLASSYTFFAPPGPADFAPDGSAFNYENRFVMPTKGNNKYYFSSDLSYIHLVAISTFTNYTKGSPQYQWLESDLQAANLNRNNFPWIIVTGYSSMYSGVGADYLLMEELESLFLKYGVDVCVWNGHYFAQSKPISGRSITDRFVGNGTKASPYLNADPIHLLVGTGGLDLVQDCTFSPDWTVAQLCTYGFTNITANKTNLSGIFRQLPYLAQFEAAKDLTRECPLNCQGNGICDRNSKKCICNTNYYGSDCAIYMTTEQIIPRNSQWGYDEGANFEVGISPFGILNSDQPAAQSNQFPAVTLISNATQIFQKNFSLSHPGPLYIATLSVKYTRQPKILRINGIQFPVVVGDEVENFYYGGRIVFGNDFILNGTFNLNANNTLEIFYDAPFLYFEASMDLDVKCIDGWTGPACNVTLNKIVPGQASTNPTSLSSSISQSSAFDQDSGASTLLWATTLLIALFYALL